MKELISETAIAVDLDIADGKVQTLTLRVTTKNSAKTRTWTTAQGAKHVHTAFVALCWAICKLVQRAQRLETLAAPRGELLVRVGRHTPAQSIDHLFSEPPQWLHDLLGGRALMEFLTVSGQRGAFDVPIGIALASESFLPREKLEVKVNGTPVDDVLMPGALLSLEMLWAASRPPHGSDLTLLPATESDIAWLNSVGANPNIPQDPVVRSINHYRVDEALRLTWYRRNPNGFSVIRRGDRPVGMVELLPLRYKEVAPLIEHDDRFDEAQLPAQCVAAPEEMDLLEGFAHVYFESIFIDPVERTQPLALQLAIDHATDILLRLNADVTHGTMYAYPVAPPVDSVQAKTFSQRRYTRTLSSVERFFERHPFERQCRTRIQRAGQPELFHELMRASVPNFLAYCADLTRGSRRNRERVRQARESKKLRSSD